MPRFIFAYHAGRAPDSPEQAQEIMAAWQRWLGDISDSVVGDSRRCGPSRIVDAQGAKQHGGPLSLAGLTHVEAPDIDAAVKLASGCPAIENGGSVEVAELLME